MSLMISSQRVNGRLVVMIVALSPVLVEADIAHLVTDDQVILAEAGFQGLKGLVRLCLPDLRKHMRHIGETGNLLSIFAQLTQNTHLYFSTFRTGEICSRIAKVSP